MEQNNEEIGCVFAVPSKTPWITSKPLVHKKPQYSEEYLQRWRYFRENDFSVRTDPVTGDVICKVMPKSQSAKRKAEQAKKLSSLVDLMDAKGYTVEDLEKLISMPKPVEEEPTEE